MHPPLACKKEATPIVAVKGTMQALWKRKVGLADLRRAIGILQSDKTKKLGSGLF